MLQQVVDEVGMITLQWSGDLTVRRIAVLKTDVEKALAAAESVAIAIAADAECDMTLMQLLCAAHRTAVSQGKTLTLNGDLPEQLLMVMKLAGFTRHIGCARDQAGCCLWKMVHQQLNN